MLRTYVEKIYNIANRGDAREESYYSVLEALLKLYADSTHRKKIEITTLPKKTEAGNPDFRSGTENKKLLGTLKLKLLQPKI